MKHLKYSDFKKAVEILGLSGQTDKSSIRENYLKLSKKFHPDMSDGDTEKFQEINEAYELLNHYVENFRFQLSKEEFQDQYPFSDKMSGDWMYG